jgi:hypothetical protein
MPRFDGPPCGGDLLLNRLGLNRLGAWEHSHDPPVAATRVVEVALLDVDDAVQPGGQGRRVGLDDLMSLLPGAGSEMIDRARERIGTVGQIGNGHSTGTSSLVEPMLRRRRAPSRNREAGADTVWVIRRRRGDRGALKEPREPCRLAGDMTTPIKPLPEDVDRWIAWARRLRGIDAAVAWLGLLAVLASIPGLLSAGQAAGLALALVVLGFLTRPIRLHWRPVSAWVGLVVSRDLRPGDRAWYVRSRRADLVLVTACHGIRLVIAPSEADVDEVLSVRRTRVLLIPADRARPPLE